MPKQTNKPFDEAVRELLEEREWSHRQLAYATQRESDWGSTSTMHHILTGRMRPTFEAMAIIASALRVPPEYFAEYRLKKLARDLTPEIVGLERALENYELLMSMGENDLEGLLDSRENVDLLFAALDAAEGTTKETEHLRSLFQNALAKVARK